MLSRLGVHTFLLKTVLPSGLTMQGAEHAYLLCNFLGCAQHPCELDPLLHRVVARCAALLGETENHVLSGMCSAINRLVFLLSNRRDGGGGGSG